MQDVEFSLGNNHGEIFDPTVTMQDVLDTLSKPYRLYLYFGTGVDRPPQVFIATEESLQTKACICWSTGLTAPCQSIARAQDQSIGTEIKSWTMIDPMVRYR